MADSRAKCDYHKSLIIIGINFSFHAIEKQHATTTIMKEYLSI